MLAFARYPNPMLDFTYAWYMWMLFAQLDAHADRDFFQLPE